MGSESSAQYIHMVQHLIEECIVFNMSKEECMEALSKHANIKPVITSTVWKELEKENKGFFEAYAKRRAERGGALETSSSTETSQRINNILLDSSNKKDGNE
ncbi:hypothetical protein PHJA_001977500 [Phtheirospermum japonicum]|uniref:Angiotensin-converting enzyme 2 n=1 Tax=Phtheirospermum japonicum TaxID=374723 RepID=A0A830CGG3_9LAMI|nr:hypothetical protein PHJA_001977500 [Phtheirospermum japonicum]